MSSSIMCLQVSINSLSVIWKLQLQCNFLLKTIRSTVYLHNLVTQLLEPKFYTKYFLKHIYKTCIQIIFALIKVIKAIFDLA